MSTHAARLPPARSRARGRLRQFRQTHPSSSLTKLTLQRIRLVVAPITRHLPHSVRCGPPAQPRIRSPWSPSQLSRSSYSSTHSSSTWRSCSVPRVSFVYRLLGRMKGTLPVEMIRAGIVQSTGKRISARMSRSPRTFTTNWEIMGEWLNHFKHSHHQVSRLYACILRQLGQQRSAKLRSLSREFIPREINRQRHYHRRAHHARRHRPFPA